jgi:SPP1 gp7 family putative phage head morphogenesis protein
MNYEKEVLNISWKSLVNSYNSALVKVLRESGFKKFVFATSTSDKTCKVCDSLNGVEFSVDEISEIFPVHPNCSCSLLPKV